MKNAHPKVDSKWVSPETTIQENHEDSTLIQDTVECLQGQDFEILNLYQDLVSEYEKSLKNIIARKIQDFKNIRNPNYSEYNIGIAMLYILACVDNSIMLSGNKKEVFDISWDAVVRTLSNSGSVCRNSRRLRPFIESTGVSENFLRYIKYHLEN